MVGTMAACHIPRTEASVNDPWTSPMEFLTTIRPLVYLLDLIKMETQRFPQIQILRALELQMSMDATNCRHSQAAFLILVPGRNSQIL